MNSTLELLITNSLIIEQGKEHLNVRMYVLQTKVVLCVKIQINCEDRNKSDQNVGPEAKLVENHWYNLVCEITQE